MARATTKVCKKQVPVTIEREVVTEVTITLTPEEAVALSALTGSVFGASDLRDCTASVWRALDALGIDTTKVMLTSINGSKYNHDAFKAALTAFTEGKK
jgi:hypothetical protein